MFARAAPKALPAVARARHGLRQGLALRLDAWGLLDAPPGHAGFPLGR